MNENSMGRGPHPRLVFLLRGCVDIVKRTGLAYQDEVSGWLEQQRCTNIEAAWIGPRCAGFAHGMTWGYAEGAHDFAQMVAMGEDNLETRVN